MNTTLKQRQEKTKQKWLNQRIQFANTARFTAQFGTVIEIDFQSEDPKAFYGFHIKTQLDSGEIITSYKFEGLKIMRL